MAQVKVGRFETGQSNVVGDNHYGVSAQIEVSPPFKQIGEGFMRTILGQDRSGVHLEHIVTTGDQSIFYAEAGLYHDPEQHKRMIGVIGTRLELLADNPSAAIDLLREEPFPYPSPLSADQ